MTVVTIPAVKTAIVEVTQGMQCFHPVYVSGGISMVQAWTYTGTTSVLLTDVELSVSPDGIRLTPWDYTGPVLLAWMEI